ncbi:ribosomal protein 63, mitochondrial [Folsomia candida]|uniref:Ribosomal protein 63, mitochondrial n=1 Tax=Folsomia candida TaxID=158441 RepID=A0A226DAM3_FOLCA|nr:ribosomal protein 63, mitochondrial [Folsomia candida]OXA41661.1 Ribosomal protein 63, mitochondrial [Folsomia candida]
MRLTLTLLGRKMPPGNIWLGKHRLGHHVYAQNIDRFVKSLKVEEQNLFLLRHPYLTLEQEKGHAQALQKHKTWMTNKRLEAASTKLVKSIRFEDKLKHLCVSDSWEI